MMMTTLLPRHCLVHPFHYSVVEILVVIAGRELGRVVLGPVNANASIIARGLLGVDWVKLLAELLELVQVVLVDGAASGSERLLEVATSDLGDGIFHVLIHFLISTITCVSGESTALLFSSDSLSDGGLAGPLAQLGDIRTSELIGQVRTEVHAHVWCDGTLTEVGLEDGKAGRLVWQWDVDELIETTWSDKGFIQDVRSVSCTDEEEVLLGACAVHLGQKLVEDSIPSTTSITLRRASSLTN